MKSVMFTLMMFFSSSSFALPYSIELYKKTTQEFQVEKSWEHSEVYVPGSFFKKTVNSLDKEQKYPVVLFAHGCTGITSHERSWARFIKDLGFIVIILDSLAIPGRIVNCDVSNNIKSLNKIPVNALRPAELDYALSQLQIQDWVDKTNIFVMGHSEGGSGVSSMFNPNNYPIKGIIISGFNCSFGVRASFETAILAVEWENDPWFKEHFYYKNHKLNCQDRWGIGRPNVQQTILPGNGHSTYESREARNAVKIFLQKYNN
jgi:hypothetical protein